MKTNFEMVREFHNAFDVPVEPRPTIPDQATKKLRVELIDEEFKELKTAIEENNIIEIADGLSDLLYVVYGTGLAFGIDLDATFAEVHRSNMSKLGADGKPIFREDGKILKGPNFSKPDLLSILKS